MKCSQTGVATASLTSIYYSSYKRCFFFHWHFISYMKLHWMTHICHSHFTNLFNQIASVLNFYFFTNAKNMHTHTHTHTQRNPYFQNDTKEEKIKQTPICQLVLSNHSFLASDSTLRRYILSDFKWSGNQFTSIILFLRQNSREHRWLDHDIM